LAKEVLPRTAKFPRDYKFALGQRITDNKLIALDLMIQATYDARRLLIGEVSTRTGS